MLQRRVECISCLGYIVPTSNRYKRIIVSPRIGTDAGEDYPFVQCSKFALRVRGRLSGITADGHAIGSHDYLFTVKVNRYDGASINLGESLPIHGDNGYTSQRNDNE